LALIAPLADRRVGTFATTGLAPPEIEPGRVVRWAGGPATIALRTFAGRGCYRLQLQLRSVDGPRDLLLHWDGDRASRSIAIGETWRGWRSDPRPARIGDDLLRLSPTGPAVSPPGDRRRLRFAVANAEIRACPR
jgi:hypothetical protein